MSEISVQAPAGWKAVPLADLASFRTGPFGSTFHKSDYQSGGIPLINPSHIVDGEIVPDEQVAVAPDLASRLSVFALKENDIVIGRRGDMGRCAVVRSHQAGFLCGTGSMIVRPRPGVSPELLQAFLASPKVVAKIEENSVGTTMINLNQGTLSALEILLPDSEHGQQAIAAALSDADGVVAGLERVIAKKRLIKQGAMQDLLTARRRLPGFSGEWGITSLGSALRRSPSYGINAPAIPRGTGGFAYLRITDISNDGTVDPSGLPSVRESASDQYLLAEGDIVVARTGASVGKSHLFRDIGEPVIFAGFLIRLCPDETKLLPSFLSQFMQTQNYWDWVRENSARSGQPGVNGQQLRTILLKLPEIEEQQAIAAVLSDMDAEVQTLEFRHAKARAVKEGMMQNLLTGRVRLV